MRDFHKPGRSPVYAMEQAVATSHPAASLVAMNILDSGGNAVDAAVAACATLCVVEPAMTGIGGDCFALYSKGGSDDIVAINGSGRTPAAAELDWFLERGITEIPTESPHAVTIPGAIAAWERLLRDHGTKGFDEILRPAIRYAEDGYVIAPRVGSDWAGAAEKLARDPGAAAALLPGGKAPEVGSIHRQPALGATMRKIAKQGRDAFYTGEVAEEIVNRLRELGGLHSVEDFAAAEPEYVTPIRSSYRGCEIVECPPNGQGLIALMILNILSGFDLSDESLSEADRIHLLAEATKQAYHQRDAILADPHVSNVPVDELLSGQTGERLRRRIDRNTAGMPALWDEPEHRDTIYCCVVDRNGNAISFINSLFHSFGSTIMAPKSGVVLHNRGSAFRVQKGHPNAIGPRKRPMHTIIPAMAVKDGKVACTFGVMGGHYQATGHAGFVSNLLDRGMDVQAAIDEPRSFAFNNNLQVERGVTEETVAELERRGHTIERVAGPLGGGQAIWMDATHGTLIAGSDPRKDGCALGR